MGLALNFPTSPPEIFHTHLRVESVTPKCISTAIHGCPPPRLPVPVHSFKLPLPRPKGTGETRCPLRFEATEIIFFIKQVYFCRGGVLCSHPGRQQKETPPLRTGPLSPQQHAVFQPSLLGTKEVGIMKSQTSYQLLKVTQAPRWT